MRRDRRPRVSIVVDTGLFREALARTLPRHGLEVVDLTKNPEVVVIDVSSAARVPVLRELAAARPATPLLAIGVRDADRDVLACIEAGAVGYVLQDGTLAELADAVHRAVRDEPLASPHVIATLMRRVAVLSENGRRDSIEALTSRELEVVELIEQGMSNKEIATQLSIAVTTVKNHVHSILEKLQVHRRGEIARRVQGMTSRPAPHT